MTHGTHDETSDPVVRWLVSARGPLLLIGLAGALGVMVTDFDFGSAAAGVRVRRQLAPRRRQQGPAIPPLPSAMTHGCVADRRRSWARRQLRIEPGDRKRDPSPPTPSSTEMQRRHGHSLGVPLKGRVHVLFTFAAIASCRPSFGHWRRL